MKTLKKLFSLTLVLLMLFALAVPAAAEGEPSDGNTQPTVNNGPYTLTITNHNTVNSSASGHSYQAYQILKGTPSSSSTVLSDITWGKNVNVENLLKALKADSTFGASTNNGFYNIDHTAEDAAEKFAAQISAPSFNTSVLVKRLSYHLSQNLKDDPASTEDDPLTSTETSSGIYNITVPVNQGGYYLIKDNETTLSTQPDSDITTIILKVAGNASVDHKGTVPTIEKKVSTNSTDGFTTHIASATNTEIFYKIICHLPSDFKDYPAYFMSVSDSMDPGIQFVPNTTQNKLVSAHILHTISNRTTDIMNAVTVKTGTEITDGNGADVVFDFGNIMDTSKYGSMLATDQLVLVYKAKLVPGTTATEPKVVLAGSGNVNSAVLHYSNNPNAIYDAKSPADYQNHRGFTTAATTRIYTYGVRVHKVDAATENVLQGVKFRLYRNIHGDDNTPSQTEQTGGNTTRDNPKEYAIVDANGWITGWTQTPTTAGVLQTTDANGHIDFKGLNSTVYYLEEVETLDAYHKLKQDIRVTIEAAYTGTTVSSASGTSDYGTTSIWYTDQAKQNPVGPEVKIPNYQGSTLPTTGGMGTTLFYLIGGIMVAAAIILLVTRKRLNSEN